MATIKVGIREFRDNLANYVLQSDSPIAITRHGDTVGFFLPVRRKRTDAEREALQEAGRHVDEMMAAAGVTEDDIMADYWKLKAESRKSKRTA
jgi:PHD/YefM family antitoxin component YafN of YafNO toxin-antitoxin module